MTASRGTSCLMLSVGAHEMVRESCWMTALTIEETAPLAVVTPRYRLCTLDSLRSSSC